MPAALTASHSSLNRDRKAVLKEFWAIAELDDGVPFSYDLCSLYMLYKYISRPDEPFPYFGALRPSYDVLEQHKIR